MHTLTFSEIAALFPKRRQDAQKGDFGKLLCITGSRNMPGACALSTHAALRSGAGLVTVFTTPENPMRLASTLPEAMWLSGATDNAGFLTDEKNHALLLPHLQKSNAVLIGCGMGLTEETRRLTHWVLSHASCPVVVDADGLNAIASSIDIERWTGKELILTPHPGEMARLSGKLIAQIQQAREETAKSFVNRHAVTLVLKGAGTLVAQRDRICQNPTGNPGMSRGGSGDTLAGMIAAFAAQGLSGWNAACAGVYLHGLAGDIAAAQYSQQAMLPSDLIACLPQVFSELEQLRDRA